MRHVVLISIVFWCTAALAEQAAPAAGASRPVPARRFDQNPEWLNVLSRIREQPWPGELRSAGVQAWVDDIFSASDADRAHADAILQEYTAAMVTQAAQWEEQQKALRAQYEARLLQSLPEEKREAARQLLELTHTQWPVEHDRNERLTQEFADKIRELNQPVDPREREQREQQRKQLREWIRLEHKKNADFDLRFVNSLKALLNADETARLLRPARRPQESSPTSTDKKPE